MIKSKKLLVVSAVLVVLITSFAFVKPDEKKQKSEFKNLKVLPKKISHDDLMKVMRGFTEGLGVKCNACHVPDKNNQPGERPKMDFASDEKPEKLMARKMIKMTAAINKKYFGKDDQGQKIIAVSCITCHRGHQHPEDGIKKGGEGMNKRD